jgi:hypothetical protein
MDGNLGELAGSTGLDLVRGAMPFRPLDRRAVSFTLPIAFPGR